MAVPRSRVSNQRKNMRRSHHAKMPKPLSVCTNCGAFALPHRICNACGYYDSRPVLKIEQKQ